MPINALIAQGIQPIGRDLIDVQQAVNRNALANREMATREQNAGAYQQSLDQQMQGRQQEQEQLSQEQARNFIGVGIQNLDAVADDPVKWNAVADQIAASPFAQRIGIKREDITPENVASLRTQIGMAPPQKATQYERVDGPRGSILQRDPATGEMKQVVGPDNSQPAPAGSGGSFRSLRPEEVAAAGLPAGTAAQVGPDGKINILNQREGLSGAEQKAMRDARMKMPRLSATLRRVDRLGAAVQSLAGNKVVDGGPADARVLKYTKQGQEMTAAAAQIMPELQALTRVPGIGSQSDLEARLASLALPSLEMSPEVNARSQAELAAFVADLKSAYDSLLEGGNVGGASGSWGGQPAAPPSGGASGGWSVTEIK